MQDAYSSYVISPANHLIICNFQGRISFSEIIQINISFLSDTDYNCAFDVLLDFRSSIAIGFEFDLREYVKFFKKSVRLEKRVKVGILYNTANQEFLISIYKPIAKLLKMDVGSFRKFDDCIAWMNYTNGERVIIEDLLHSIKAKDIVVF